MNGKFIDNLNTNKYFTGAIMIILTLGGRFIIGELDEKTKKIISEKKTCRRFLVFCAFFMATRDIIKAILLTVVFSLIIDHFMHATYENDLDDILKEVEEKDDKGVEINELIVF